MKKLVHDGQEVVTIGGVHSLHRHEKLAIAVSKAMRSHSMQETKNDGRFHVQTKTYLDGAILKEVSIFILLAFGIRHTTIFLLLQLKKKTLCFFAISQMVYIDNREIT